MVGKTNKGAIVVLALLFVGVIAGAGCIGEKAPYEEGVSPAEKVTPPAETATAPLRSESLSDLLGKAKGIGSCNYDLEITSPEMPMITQKVWVKGNNMRMEMTAEEVTMVIIMKGDEQALYMYNPEENSAVKMDFHKAPESAIEEVAAIEGYHPTVIGTETIDGKLCTVVEYTAPEGKAMMWIWQKHGFPIQMEMTMPQGTLRMAWTNIEFDDISDSMFELPAGVDIMEIPELPAPMGGAE